MISTWIIKRPDHGHMIAGSSCSVNQPGIPVYRIPLDQCQASPVRAFRKDIQSVVGKKRGNPFPFKPDLHGLQSATHSIWR